MERREFLSFAGASAVIPVLPLPAPTIPVVVAPIDAAKVDWAALYARTHGRATPELIQKWLHVSPDQARAVMSDLVRKNVVAAPVAGSAAAIRPMYPSRSIQGARLISEKAKAAVKDFAQSTFNDINDPQNTAQPQVSEGAEDAPKVT